MVANNLQPSSTFQILSSHNTTQYNSKHRAGKQARCLIFVWIQFNSYDTTQYHHTTIPMIIWLLFVVVIVVFSLFFLCFLILKLFLWRFVFIFFISCISQWRHKRKKKKSKGSLKIMIWKVFFNLVCIFGIRYL